MLSRSFLLVAVASIAVLAVSAEDCTTKTSFVDCLKPSLNLDPCPDGNEMQCRCRFIYIEADCYQKHCSNEKNPVEKEIQECDRVGARNSTGSMSDSSNKEEDPESPQPENKSFNSSTSDASTNPSSSAAERGGSTGSAAAAAASTAANQPSAAVPSTACSIFSMTLGVMALVMVRVLDWI